VRQYNKMHLTIFKRPLHFRWQHRAASCSEQRQAVQSSSFAADGSLLNIFLQKCIIVSFSALVINIFPTFNISFLQLNIRHLLLSWYVYMYWWTLCTHCLNLLGN
jgi:hypothetical protein